MHITKYLTSVFFTFALASIFTISAHAGLIAENNVRKKIIVVNVIARGQAIIGRDTFSFDGLTKELKQRFWKSFTGTGKMQDAVQLQFSENVLMGVRSAAMDAIKKAQKEALADLCLQLHKKEYDELSSRQQAKIKRQYPILFQQKF